MKWERRSVTDALLCFLIALLLMISSGAAKLLTIIAVLVLIILIIIRILGIEPENGTMGSDIIKRMNVMLWVLVIAAFIAEILCFII